jgi:hypothetical protein
VLVLVVRAIGHREDELELLERVPVGPVGRISAEICAGRRKRRLLKSESVIGGTETARTET